MVLIQCTNILGLQGVCSDQYPQNEMYYIIESTNVYDLQVKTICKNIKSINKLNCQYNHQTEL